jgi:hypothetical protein
MIVYISFFLMMGLLTFLRSKVFLNQKKFLTVSVFFILALFSGLRGTVGSDTLNYLNIYSQSPEISEFFSVSWPVEPGYLLLNSIHNSIFDNGFLYFLVYSFFQAFLVITLSRKNENPSLFLFIYILIFYLNFHFNILRAGTATLFLLLALQSKSSFKAIVLFALGISFHFSIMVAFPLLLVGRGLSLRHFIYISFGILSLVGMFFYSFFDLILLKVLSYASSDIYNRSSYPIILFFTSIIFVSTILSYKGRVPKVYFVSGILLLLSLLVNFYVPGFYRVTLIYLVIFFWYLTNFFKFNYSVYAASYFLFFFYHAYVALNGIYGEKAALQHQASLGDPRITAEVLETTYIPYDFYWNDIED